MNGEHGADVNGQAARAGSQGGGHRARPAGHRRKSGTRSGRHRQGSRRKIAGVAAGVVAIVVVTGAVYSSVPQQGGGTTPSAAAPVAALGVTGASATGAPQSGDAAAASSSAARSSAATPAASAASAAASSRRTAAPSATGTHAATPAPRAAAMAAGQSSATAQEVQQVLALINKARAAQGLSPYTITAGLTRSATAHNQVMAGGCGLSHQCPGEDELGARETAAGVQWGAAGENIGEGGPVSTATSDIASMAVGLTQSMLNEQPPDDGHRRNILSSTFTHIGIAIERDAQGTVWMTQDFSD
ncbi:CAP domain-containing protein [Streptacidiphilus sp. EB129]|uniref:CAP domain-containing protein n=1 Tax=Streptacidiphilus sp. EB129 TaxID=3156262 RepID=UPI0035137408